MRPWASLLALVAVPASVAAQAPPAGYVCDEPAFAELMSFKGKVSLETDREYRPGAAEFVYQVSDHVTGFGRMTATWPIEGKSIAVGGGRVFIPLWRDRSALPLSITVTLDGQMVGTRRLESRGDKVAVLDQSGRPIFEQTQVALFSDKRDPWIPALWGHSMLSYRVADANGAAVGGDDLLLPNPKKVAETIGPALRRAEGQRKHKQCSPFYRLSRG